MAAWLIIALVAVGVIGALGAGSPARGDPAADAEPAVGAEATEVTDVTDIRELSLADLLDTEVDVASRKPQTTRATPGIVTVITRDDIINSGARELLDVLTLVPGFAPGVDVEGVIGLGIRGQWGHEGKILLLIDGQPMNELLYSSLQLGNHYPLESIERIEVIRGPGSVIYGGYAELAVINIVMRDAASLEGVAVAGLYGQLGHTVGHANASLTFGTTSTGVAGLGLAGSLALGHATSNGTYRDFEGNRYAMSGNSDLAPRFFKLAVTYRGLRADAIVDAYAVQTRDMFGPVEPMAVVQQFRTYALDARYTLALTDHLHLTPRFSVIRQSPWQITEPSSPAFYQKTISRYTTALVLSYDATERLNLLAGVETYSDRAHLDDEREIGAQTHFDGESEVAYDTIATYGQLLLDHSIANLTLGARYEYQGTIGGSLVPRIALTKVVGRFHAKLLASQAFRAPSVENINLGNGSLEPEKTTVFEAEAGYELGEHMFVAANVFDITIKKPIIYEYDQATSTEVYQNFDRTGTRGLELDYRLKYPRGSAHLTYSYYSAAGKNAVDTYRVPGHDAFLLAFPAHKVTLSGTMSLARNLTLNPSAVIYGERFGYMTADADGEPLIGRQAPTALVNLYLRYRDAFVPGLELGAGVYNVVDQRTAYLQPYNGGHPPLPGMGRELIFRIAYERKL